MIDETFIERTVQRGRQAREKALIAFSELTLNQLNWKPSSSEWSIAQCLEHLLISDSAYFSELQKITAGQYSMTFWQKYSPFTYLFGKFMTSRLREDVKVKMKTHRRLTPQSILTRAHFIDEYICNLDSFLNYVSNCKGMDLDEVILTSPVVGFVTYSLRDALQFLVEHEHRHINQAIRVKQRAGFPI